MVRGAKRLGAVRRWLLASCLVIGLGALAPAGAHAVSGVPAHAELRSVTPANGATLAAPPAELVLVFNEDINPAFVQVTLTRAGAPVALADTSVSRGTVTAPVPAGPDVGAGSYRIAYRVVSTDGHPVSGSSEFTVTAAPAAAATPTAPPSSPAASSPAPATVATPPGSVTAVAASTSAESSSGMPALVIGAVLVVAAGAGLLLWNRRRRAGASAE